MKKPYYFLAAAAGIILLASSCCTRKGLPITNLVYADQTTPLKPLLQEVKRQYDIATDHIPPKIAITEVDAVFDVANSSAIDGNISVWIAKADYKRTTAGETTVTFTLSDAKDNAKAFHLDPIPDKEKLAKLIVNTVNDFLAIHDVVIGGLTPQTFEIDINYSVDNDGTIELSPTLGKVGLDGSYERDHKVTQTIELKFELKKNPTLK